MILLKVNSNGNGNGNGYGMGRIQEWRNTLYRYTWGLGNRNGNGYGEGGLDDAALGGVSGNRTSTKTVTSTNGNTLTLATQLITYYGGRW